MNYPTNDPYHKPRIHALHPAKGVLSERHLHSANAARQMKVDWMGIQLGIFKIIIIKITSFHF